MLSAVSLFGLISKAGTPNQTGQIVPGQRRLSRCATWLCAGARRRPCGTAVVEGITWVVSCDAVADLAGSLRDSGFIDAEVSEMSELPMLIVMREESVSRKKHLPAFGTAFTVRVSKKYESLILNHDP